MKILLTLLSSHKIDKLNRLVGSVTRFREEPRIDLEVVIVINTLSDEYFNQVLQQNYPYTVVRTESNGWPGKGKNSCLDIFMNSNADFWVQLDGDDLFYPTFLQSLANNMERYKGSIDVLGLVPTDKVLPYKIGLGHEFPVGESFWACVWGISVCWPGNNPPGPARGAWINDRLPVSQNTLMLRSRKSCEYRFPEDLPNGEDSLTSVRLLKAHQDGKINYFLTMSSDWYCYDETVEDSIQKQFLWEDYVEDWRTRVYNSIDPNRSSFFELPMIYSPLLLSPEEKQDWITKYF